MPMGQNLNKYIGWEKISLKLWLEVDWYSIFFLADADIR